MHDFSLAHTHGGRSTLEDNFDTLPKFMDNTPNHDKIYTDETHDFIKLYNAANDDNDATQNYNDSPYPTDSDFCKYYTPHEFVQTIGIENKQIAMLCLNCRSINANWESLNELFYSVTNSRFQFDFLGLTEIFKIHDNFIYSINGYHDIEFNTRHDSDDGHGGVGLYIKSTVSYSRRDDLSIFIPNVIESIFIEAKLNEKNL